MKYIISKIKSLVLRAPYSDLRGLTFIELIVVATIFSILAAVALFQFGGFTSNVSLQNISQDIALRMVQAQRDGSSGAFPRFIVPAQSLLIPSPWTPSFGMHFYIDSSQGYTDKFTYFFDSTNFPNPKQYNGSSNTCDPTTECLDLITINSGDKIVALCVETSSSSCTFDGSGQILTGSPVTNLDVVYTRPNLSAKITVYPETILQISAAKIVVQSKNGEQHKTITVYPVGQIAVD